MTEIDRQEISAATVETLLSWVRFTPIGQGWFEDQEAGKLVLAKLAERRERDPEAFTAASKRLGW